MENNSIFTAFVFVLTLAAYATPSHAQFNGLGRGLDKTVTLKLTKTTSSGEWVASVDAWDITTSMIAGHGRENAESLKQYQILAHEAAQAAALTLNPSDPAYLETVENKLEGYAEEFSKISLNSLSTHIKQVNSACVLLPSACEAAGNENGMAKFGWAEAANVSSAQWGTFAASADLATDVALTVANTSENIETIKTNLSGFVSFDDYEVYLTQVTNMDHKWIQLSIDQALLPEGSILAVNSNTALQKFDYLDAAALDVYPKTARYAGNSLFVYTLVPKGSEQPSSLDLRKVFESESNESSVSGSSVNAGTSFLEQRFNDNEEGRCDKEEDHRLPISNDLVMRAINGGCTAFIPQAQNLHDSNSTVAVTAGHCFTKNTFSSKNTAQRLVEFKAKDSIVDPEVKDALKVIPYPSDVEHQYVIDEIRSPIVVDGEFEDWAVFRIKPRSPTFQKVAHKKYGNGFKIQSLEVQPLRTTELEGYVAGHGVFGPNQFKSHTLQEALGKILPSEVIFDRDANRSIEVVNHRVDTDHGSSGSPIFIKEGTNLELIGVHVGGFCNQDLDNNNFGVSINNENLLQALKMI